MFRYCVMWVLWMGCVACSSPTGTNEVETDSQPSVDLQSKDGTELDARYPIGLDSTVADLGVADWVEPDFGVADGMPTIQDVITGVSDSGGLPDIQPAPDTGEIKVDMGSPMPDTIQSPQDIAQGFDMQSDTMAIDLVDPPLDMGWTPPILPEGLIGTAVEGFPAVAAFNGVVNSDGIVRTLADLKGKPTVLWFYPAASTSG